VNPQQLRRIGLTLNFLASLLLTPQILSPVLKPIRRFLERSSASAERKLQDWIHIISYWRKRRQLDEGISGSDLDVWYSTLLLALATVASCILFTICRLIHPVATTVATIILILVFLAAFTITSNRGDRDAEQFTSEVPRFRTLRIIAIGVGFVLFLVLLGLLSVLIVILRAILFGLQILVRVMLVLTRSGSLQQTLALILGTTCLVVGFFLRLLATYY